MDEIRYLTLDEAIGLHDQIVELTGSPACPLLRRDVLVSALERPRNAAYYEGADLTHQAVLLLVGISQAQAFLDGNKRAAVAVAHTFLRINGHAYAGDPLELAHELESVAEAPRQSREARVEAFETWYRPRVAKLA